MRLSFRVRQFLYAAVALGLVLGVVGVLGWVRVLAFEVSRLDDRLCMEARRLAAPSRPGESADRLTEDVALKLRLQSPDQLMVQAQAPDDTLRLRTPRWESGPASSWEPQPGRRPAPGRPPGSAAGGCDLVTVDLADGPWRRARMHTPEGHAELAVPLDAVKSELRGALTQALALVLPVGLVLAALSAWLLATLSLRPVRRLRDAMRQLTPQALSQRLPDRGEDHEFSELIAAYNAMLDRLDASFHQASRFSADAAHELRTPLTILRGRLEQALRHSDRRAIQGDLAEMLDEVGRLSGITRKLLMLSQADAGKLPLNLEPVDLSRLLADLVDDMQSLTQPVLDSEVAPGLVISADGLLVRQLFNNLFSNAVRHGLPGGRIGLRARSTGDGVEVVLTNPCAALSREQRAQLFQRFFRVDPARGRQVDGTGLGLSLAREIARAHGGDLVLDDSADDVVSLRVRLPAR